EISYIHAEGYATGELKHGPIALIDEATPVIVIAPTDALFEKSLSNMSEVGARGAQCAGGSAGDLGSTLRPDPAPAGLRAAYPAPGLLRGGPEGRRRRPAAEPGQIGHRRIAPNAIQPPRGTAVSKKQTAAR